MNWKARRWEREMNAWDENYGGSCSCMGIRPRMWPQEWVAKGKWKQDNWTSARKCQQATTLIYSDSEIIITSKGG